MSAQLARLRATDADALILAGSAPGRGGRRPRSGSAGLARPVLTTWSVSGGDFVERAGVENTERCVHPPDLLVLRPAFAEGIHGPAGVPHPVRHPQHRRSPERAVGSPGLRRTAHAGPGDAEGEFNGWPARPRRARAIARKDGLVAHYAPPFTSTNHEALRADSYLMAIWQAGQLVPAPQPRLR